MGVAVATCAFAAGSAYNGGVARLSWAIPSREAVGSRRSAAVPAVASSASAPQDSTATTSRKGFGNGACIATAAITAATIAAAAKRSRAGRGSRRGAGAVTLSAQADDFGLPPKLAAMSAALKSLPNDKLRYQQLLAMAAKLAPMPAELKTPENKVPGCLSTVHVHAELTENGTLNFYGDSDALISKGLVALLVNGLQGCTTDEIARVKPEFIQASGITASLTPGRNNGFFNMYKLMNKKAAELAAGTHNSAAAESPEVAAALVSRRLAGKAARPATALASAPDVADKAEDEIPVLRINNSMSRQREVFKPLTPGVVNMYVCGVTVYDLCHLGHARVMVFFDVVARYLRHLGYEVNYVRNVTDVDDKIIKRSREAGETVESLSRRMEEEMQRDAASLGCEPPTAEPRVSDHIDQIVSMVQGLEDRGHAYPGTPDEGVGSDVYFRVRSFPQYGRLSRCNLDGNQAGARVEVGGGKEAPEDFVLWKAAKPGEPQWETRWGRGRPGWHIECSAMARQHLGDTLDIHGGGPDLMFPHHENEIAQSEAHNGKLYVRTWMHCAAVRSGGQEKMSKSLGNFVTIRDVLSTHDGEALRFYLLSSQYRQPMQYSQEKLAQAEERLLLLYSSLRGVTVADSDEVVEPEEDILERRRRFEGAMSNDFDTVNAVTVINELAKELRQLQQGERDHSADRRATALARELRSMGSCLGILQRDPESVLRGRGAGSGGEEVDSDFEARVDALIVERAAARKARNFARADEIRAELTDLGVVLNDAAGSGGKTTWRRAAVPAS